MSAPQPARRQRGLTLIELMVALAIFAVLGVLSYRALAEVSTSRTRLEEGFERWRSIGRAMQRIDADLLQLEGGVVVDGVGVHDQSIVGDDLGACIAQHLDQPRLLFARQTLTDTDHLLAK